MGTANAVLLSQHNEVVCYDLNADRINLINKKKSPIEDQEASEYLAQKKLNLRGVSDFPSQEDFYFVIIATPTNYDPDTNYFDTSTVESCIENLHSQNSKATIVIRSTLPVGFVERIQKKYPNQEIIFVPEFLREGAAVNDFMRSDRLVIGCENKKSEDMMRDLYRPLYLLETPIVSTTVESAEIIKYASNSFLATKISFINQVADLCEKVGADVQDVAKGMGIDKRIGKKFLHAGPGYGGSCFPKDVKAFIRTAKQYDVDLSILSSVDSFNEERVKKITNNFFSKANLIKGDKVSLLGLSFKPNTDDVRDSTSLKIAKLLQDKGIVVKSYDPEAMKNAKRENTELQLCNNAYVACEDTKAIIIGTEWNEFRALDFLKIKGSSKNLVIFDLRNIYNAKEIKNLGFQYFGTGK